MIFEKIESLQGGTYAFVDVETTGSSPTFNQVIEIGIIRVEDGEIVDTYQTLIRPERMLSAFISDLTGIEDDDFKGMPAFEDIAERVREMLSGAVFVAHNARFDYSFIKNEFRRLGISWNAKTLCTVKISRRLYPTERSHNLDSLIERHSIPMKNRHRAYDDAYALIDFIQAAEREQGIESIQNAFMHALGNHTLPSALDPKLVKDLPHSPGVYLFYGNENDLLYVGKSIDIKTRVLSHFSQDYASTKERALTEQVAYIEYETTSGELSALLRESELIKKLAPLYNKRLRAASRLAVLESSLDDAGYKVATISYVDSEDILDTRNIEGIYRTVSQGKTALRNAVTSHTLCPKLLGIENTKGPCFQYQLQKCNGACIGKEDTATYNKRFTKAFARQRIKSWPFKNSIVLPEDPEAEEGVSFVVDQWKIQKTISFTSEGFDEKENESSFDYDTYRILAKHLLRPDIKKTIRPYPFAYN